MNSETGIILKRSMSMNTEGATKSGCCLCDRQAQPKCGCSSRKFEIWIALATNWNISKQTLKIDKTRKRFRIWLETPNYCFRFWRLKNDWKLGFAFECLKPIWIWRWTYEMLHGANIEMTFWKLKAKPTWLRFVPRTIATKMWFLWYEFWSWDNFEQKYVNQYWRQNQIWIAACATDQRNHNLAVAIGILKSEQR